MTFLDWEKDTENIAVLMECPTCAARRRKQGRPIDRHVYRRMKDGQMLRHSTRFGRAFHAWALEAQLRGGQQ